MSSKRLGFIQLTDTENYEENEFLYEEVHSEHDVLTQRLNSA